MSHVINKDVFNKNVNKMLVYEMPLSDGGRSISMLDLSTITRIIFIKENELYKLKIYNNNNNDEPIFKMVHEREEPIKKEYNKILNIIINNKDD